jgi:S1-C subfamily serine protease
MRHVLAAVCALALPALVAAQESVYKKAIKSTVWIVQPINRDGKSLLRTGSGSVIDVKQKLILTNYHVVEDIADATVCFPLFDKQGKLIPEKDKYRAVLNEVGLKGRVIAKDATRDLAVIKLAAEMHLPAGTPALRLGKEAPDPGTHVHSIGSPGISSALFNYTGGDVKSVGQKQWRAMRMPNDPNPLQLSARVIETSSGTNKGDSGGPLMNDRAELVGVTQGVSFGPDANPVAYFIAVEEVRDMLKKNKITISTATAGAAVAADKPKDPPMTAAATTPGDDSAKREAEAAGKLELTKDLLKAGKAEKAKERLEEIVKKYAGTKAADEAKALLEKK